MWVVWGNFGICSGRFGVLLLVGFKCFEKFVYLIRYQLQLNEHRYINVDNSNGVIYGVITEFRDRLCRGNIVRADFVVICILILSYIGI